MLTQALYAVGKAIIGGEPHAENEADAMKLLARSNVELDVAVGSIVLFLLGFLLIISLGLLTESVWHSKVGAGAGGCICAIGIVGYLLHYARSRLLRRRADRLDRGEPVQDPLKETFWTSSSDIDLVFQLALGIVVLILNLCVLTWSERLQPSARSCTGQDSMDLSKDQRAFCGIGFDHR